MREVVSIHVGQAGVQIGQAVWELYCLEHGILPNGTALDRQETESYEGLTSFFHETRAGGYVPRALLIDLEPTVIDEVKKGPMKDLYHPNHLLNWNEDAANNFARGYISIGRKVTDHVMDTINRIADNCESLQGFIIFNSIGGGTGSGFGSLLSENISDTFGEKEKLQFCVYPSPKVSTAVVEPYNAVLSTAVSLDDYGCSFISDNEALYTICKKFLNIDCPNYNCVNRILARGLSYATANLRFDGLINVDLNEIRTNLVPFPSIHFPSLSYAPIMTLKSAAKSSNSVSELTRACFEPRNQTVSCYSKEGRYLSCSLLYKGDVNPQDVNKVVRQIKANNRIQFSSWTPKGFKVGVNLHPPTGVSDGDAGTVERAVCLLANKTSIVECFNRINLKFDLMYAKKAFLHWYENEGLERNFFAEARENLAQLEKAYEELDSS